MYPTIRISLMFRSVKRVVYQIIVSTLLVAAPAFAVDTLPILWEAGGQSAGNDSAGQAARIATDASGNVAVVSGPSVAKDLAVTSYTSTGSFRWQNAVSPSSGTFAGDWVAAAPNGDFVAVGHNVTSSGQSIAITLVRFGSDGAFQWRVDLGGLFPSVGRLLVDSGGNAYLAFNSLGDGQDIQLHKYSPAGALLWSQDINTGFASNNIATSLAFSPDQTEIAVTGDTIGGAEWITALYNTSTGVRKWLVVASEGTAALDVVIDAAKVYVTGLGKVGINGFLTVVAYDRATGVRLWRTDKKPADGGNAAGLRMTLAPDGSLVATGQASRGFLDWYTVAFETTGAVRWEAVRDGGLNTDEIPAAVLALADGTIVVTGKGGPNLPGGFIPGVTVGYSPAGVLLWEAFSPLATVWVTDLPNGDVVATGGYDAYLAAFRPVLPGEVVNANQYTVFRGLHVSGDLSDSFESDDSYLKFNPGFTINSAEAPVWLIFDASLPSDSPASLEIVMESTAGTPGLTHTLEAWNWTSAVYDVVDVSTASFNDDVVVTVSLSSAISDYAQAETGAVRTRVGWRKTGFTINYPWEVRLDQMAWIVQ